MLSLTRIRFVTWLLGAAMFALILAKVAVWLTAAMFPKKELVTEPKQVLTAVYTDANRFFQGDTLPLTTNLNTYCSKPLLAVFKQIPSIMTYTFARETKNGQLSDLTILSQQFTGPDSALIKAKAIYSDGTSKSFEQVFIREDAKWKLGLKYGRTIK